MSLSDIITNKGYSIYEEKLEKEIVAGPMPKHIAIIMDGNRRYAREEGKDVKEGHLAGKEKIREVMDWSLKLGIRNLTVYAFSTENFNREESEVSFLMELIESSLSEMAHDERIHKDKVRLRVIGERDLIPDSMISTIKEAEELTKD